MVGLANVAIDVYVLIDWLYDFLYSIGIIQLFNDGIHLEKSQVLMSKNILRTSSGTLMRNIFGGCPNSPCRKCLQTWAVFLS